MMKVSFASERAGARMRRSRPERGPLVQTSGSRAGQGWRPDAALHGRSGAISLTSGFASEGALAQMPQFKTGAEGVMRRTIRGQAGLATKCAGQNQDRGEHKRLWSSRISGGMAA